MMTIRMPRLDLLLIGFPKKKMLRRLISLELESMMLLMNALQFTITGQVVTVNLKCATGLLFGVVCSDADLVPII